MEPLPGLPQVVSIVGICTDHSHLLDVETSNKNPTSVGVNTFAQTTVLTLLGKLLMCFLLDALRVARRSKWKSKEEVNP